MIQISHLYITARKPIVLTRQTVVGKMISLLYNMLSRFFIAFLLRSKHLLISWLYATYSVILDHRKVKSVTAFTFLN